MTNQRNTKSNNTKQNKVIILLICIFFLVSGIITAIAIYYKAHPVENENIITEAILDDIVIRNENSEEIKTSEFKKYTVLSKEVIDGFTYTYYEYNELYDINTVTLGERVLAVYLVNRVTGTSCDILSEDMYRFLEND